MSQTVKYNLTLDLKNFHPATVEEYDAHDQEKDKVSKRMGLAIDLCIIHPLQKRHK